MSDDLSFDAPSAVLDEDEATAPAMTPGAIDVEEGEKILAESGEPLPITNPLPPPPARETPADTAAISRQVAAQKTATLRRAREIIVSLADGDPMTADSMVVFTSLDLADAEISDLVRAVHRGRELEKRVQWCEETADDRAANVEAIKKRLADIADTITKLEERLLEVRSELQRASRLPWGTEHPERTLSKHRAGFPLLYGRLMTDAELVS